MKNSFEPPKVILIYGPTACGKSNLSIELARNIGEIISADSMQIYRNMDIGTAKISIEERNLVPHHLIDILPPTSSYTVQEFLNHCNQLIPEIIHRGKIPFIVGGTGFYFKTLIDGLFKGPSANPEIRSHLESEVQNNGLYLLHQRLSSIDPNSADKIHPNDKKRIIRALEVYEMTSKPLSQFWSSQKKNSQYNFIQIGLTMDRQELYHRIDQRCNEIINNGLINEVQALIDEGLNLHHQSMQAIGYKHFYNHLNGMTGLPETIRLFKRDTRRFAKRQWTLFNHMENTKWFYPTDISGIKSSIHDFLQTPELLNLSESRS